MTLMFENSLYLRRFDQKIPWNVEYRLHDWFLN